MKLIIAGGRDYKFTRADIKRLNEIRDDFNIVEVVSGKARGADSQGELWANWYNIPIKPFPADWKKFNKMAGFLRNTEMSLYADALAIFKGGNGTADMLKKAKKENLVIFDFQEQPLDFDEEFGKNEK